MYSILRKGKIGDSYLNYTFIGEANCTAQVNSLIEEDIKKFIEENLPKENEYGKILYKTSMIGLGDKPGNTIVRIKNLNDEADNNPAIAQLDYSTWDAPKSKIDEFLEAINNTSKEV